MRRIYIYREDLSSDQKYAILAKAAVPKNSSSPETLGFIYIFHDGIPYGYGRALRYPSGYVRIEDVQRYYSSFSAPEIIIKTDEEGMEYTDEPLVPIAGVLEQYRRFFRQIKTGHRVIFEDNAWMSFDPATGEMNKISGAFLSDVREFIVAGYLQKEENGTYKAMSPRKK